MTVDRKFPGVNFAAPQTYDTLEFEQQVYTEEILERLKLVFGFSLDLDQQHHGIVATEDPGLAQETDTLPFVVRLNDADPTKIDILPGIAVTLSGDRIVLPITVLGKDLATTTEGGVNIVFLEYNTEYSTTKKVNHWNIPVAIKRLFYGSTDAIQGVGAYVKVLAAADYNDLSQNIRNHTVALAVVNMMPVDPAAGGGAEAVVDLSRVNYAFIRPWFSPIDIAHRMRLGSGTETEGNPHRMSLNDLAATAGLSLYELENSIGIVLAKDVSVSGVPGYICSETIPYTNLIQDDGSITGLDNVYYARLTAFPIRIGRALPEGVDELYDELDIAVDHIPNTNIVFFPNTEFNAADENTEPGWTKRGVTVWYTRALMGEPSNWTSGTTIQFGQGTAKEAAITAGGAYSSLASDEVSFSDAGPSPVKFMVFIDQDGDLNKIPQVILPYIRLDAIGLPEEISVSLLGTSRIMIAMTQIPTVSDTLEVKIDIAGKDAEGLSQNETLTFDSTYRDVVVPFPPWQSSNATFQGTLLDLESPQRVFSTKLFSEIETVSVITATDVGNDAALIFYAIPDTANTESMRGICPLCEAFWDGYRIADLRDIRRIKNTFEPMESHFDFIQGQASLIWQLQQAAGLLGIAAPAVVAESFENPQLHHLNEIRTDLRSPPTVRNPAYFKPSITGTLVSTTAYHPSSSEIWGVAFPLGESYYVGRTVLVRHVGPVFEPVWDEPYSVHRIKSKISDDELELEPPLSTPSEYYVYAEILERESSAYPLYLTQRDREGFGYYESRVIALQNDNDNADTGSEIGADQFFFTLIPGMRVWNLGMWNANTRQHPHVSGQPFKQSTSASAPFDWANKYFRLEARFRMRGSSSGLQYNKQMTSWKGIKPALAPLAGFGGGWYCNLASLTTESLISEAFQFRLFSYSGYRPRGIIITAGKAITP